MLQEGKFSRWNIWKRFEAGCKEFNQKIHQVSILLNVKVVVEKPLKTVNPPQCKWNCSTTLPISTVDSHPLRVKSGNEHFTKDCINTRDLPGKLDLCFSALSINYKNIVYSSILKD